MEGRHSPEPQAAPAADILALEEKQQHLIQKLNEMSEEEGEAPSKESNAIMRQLLKIGMRDFVLNIVEKLEDDPDQAYRGGRTPLVWAALVGHLDIVEDLVKRGASVNKKCNNRYYSRGTTTPLGAATTNGHLDIVKFLVIECDANIDENAPLSTAAEEGHLDIVEFLVERHGSNIHKKTRETDMLSRLMHATISAAKGGSLNVIKLIATKFGAVIDEVRNETGRSLAAYAAKNGHLDVVRFLLKECDVSTGYIPKILDAVDALEDSTTYGHVNVLRFLVDDCGLDINRVCTITGEPIVYDAILRQNDNSTNEVIDYIIDKQKINLSSKEGEELFNYAVSMGREESVILLHEKGAKVTLPILKAAAGCRSKSVDNFAYLVEQSENKLDSKHAKKLHEIALVAGNSSIVGYLDKKIVDLEESEEKVSLLTDETKERLQYTVELDAEIKKASNDPAKQFGLLKQKTFFELSRPHLDNARQSYYKAKDITSDDITLRLLRGLIENYDAFLENDDEKRKKHFATALKKYFDPIIKGNVKMSKEDLCLICIGQAAASAGLIDAVKILSPQEKSKLDHAVELKQIAKDLSVKLDKYKTKIYDRNEGQVRAYQVMFEREKQFQEEKNRLDPDGFKSSMLQEFADSRARDVQAQKDREELKDLGGHTAAVVNTITERQESNIEVVESLRNVVRNPITQAEKCQAAGCMIASLGIAGLSIGVGMTSSQEDGTATSRAAVAVAAIALTSALIAGCVGIYKRWDKSVASLWQDRCKSTKEVDLELREPEAETPAPDDAGQRSFAASATARKAAHQMSAI